MTAAGKNRPPGLVQGVKMQPAICTGCGRKGKSQHPEGYTCTGCWHDRQAVADIARAGEIEARAARLRESARQHTIKAEAFRSKKRKDE